MATPDRETSIAWYAEKLGLERGADYTLPYTMVSDAFGLPRETQTTITTVQKRRMPIVEVSRWSDYCWCLRPCWEWLPERVQRYASPRSFHERYYDGFIKMPEEGWVQSRHVTLLYDGVVANRVEWQTVRIGEPIEASVFVYRGE